MRDRIVFLSFAAMALASCAGLDWTTQAMETDSMHYGQPLTLTKNRVHVTVYWKPENQIGAFCNTGANACALLVEDECYIYMPKISGWNNAPMQKRLGHEMLHCFGGKHEVKTVE